MRSRTLQGVTPPIKKVIPMECFFGIRFQVARIRTGGMDWYLPAVRCKLHPHYLRHVLQKGTHTYRGYRKPSLFFRFSQRDHQKENSRITIFCTVQEAEEGKFAGFRDTCAAVVLNSECE